MGSSSSTHVGGHVIGHHSISHVGGRVDANIIIMARSSRTDSSAPGVTMQNLKDRLASYLEQVPKLESANADLDLKIRKFLESKTSPSAGDYSAFYATIADLLAKIQDATRTNRSVDLAIDNAKLESSSAASDLEREENELSVRQSVEAFITELRSFLEELALSRADLKMQIEDLKEDLTLLKKNHGEMSGQVNATPGVDLAKIIAKTQTLDKEVALNTESLQTSRSEVSEVKCTLQGPEIQQGSPADTQNQYRAKLVGVLSDLTILGEELAQLRADLERQGGEYQILLDTKTRLETEIAKYRSSSTTTQ